MKISEHNSKPRVLVLGASGLTGNAIASILDNEAADIEVVRAARNKEKVETWKRDGKQPSISTSMTHELFLRPCKALIDCSY